MIMYFKLFSLSLVKEMFPELLVSKPNNNERANNQSTAKI